VLGAIVHEGLQLKFMGNATDAGCQLLAEVPRSAYPERKQEGLYQGRDGQSGRVY